MPRCEIRYHRFKSWLYTVLGEWPKANNLTSLKTSLSLQLYIMKGYKENKTRQQENTYNTVKEIDCQ